ncbi:hypothetical protein [Chitinophaga nivalis]|uniref:DUF4440 domain-containing protein n=1 Tax=Chitinophaga nivalis TaxID=2991709 RepID=A0ABT3IIC5_9BACT|nr:hypothetical protein [Chitinophaga nivalis]MCW3466603.1 hypothetical protein [Chitinophaga nivalis]MCW3483706.1 hypothetical protein [Chitinophaga nivalis]
MDLTTSATQTIIRFQDRIQDWFRGTVTKNAENEQAILADFDPAFHMIGINGGSQTLTTLAAWLPVAYGSRPGVTVTIKDFVVHYEQPGMVLIGYEEVQELESGVNRRVGTALFVPGPDGNAKWRYLQETVLPA